MYKTTKRMLAFVLSLVMLLTFSFSHISTAETMVAGSKDYYISDPYATVNWTTFGQYKADFHVHSTESDGNASPAAMIEDHYAKGFDIMALTDHNFTNTTWDRTDRPANRPYLTIERLAEINAGVGRDGIGMIGIPYSNEQSRSDHVNTFWADFNNVAGATLEGNIAQCEELGGISHINHPGRYTGARNMSFDAGAARSKEPAVVAKYVNLFMKYPSCVGMEIINKKDGDSISDRILWDNILMQTMPNRPVWGFSNDDTHSIAATGFSYNIMLMPKNTPENVRYSMENGTFYAVALVSKRELGIDFVASGPAPKITNIIIDQNENAITISGENYDTVEWIADDEIIATGSSIDLNHYEDKVNNYVRAQLKGAGGISFTQPFGVYDIAERINNLTRCVESLDLNKGLINSLTVKLDNALKMFEKNNQNSVNIVNAFINEVNALYSEGKLPQEDAVKLVKLAEEIVQIIPLSR